MSQQEFPEVLRIVKAQRKLLAHGQFPTAKGRADITVLILGRGSGRCWGNPKAPEADPGPEAPAAEAETAGITLNSGSGSGGRPYRWDSHGMPPTSNQMQPLESPKQGEALP